MIYSVYRKPGQVVPDDTLDKCGHNCHGFLSPAVNEKDDPFLYRLPVELVSEIFEQTLPFRPCSEVFDSDFCAKRQVQAVKTLGRICRNWRNIARSTPRLWTIISIDLGQINDKANPYLMAYQWLKLSKTLPIFLRLQQSNPRLEDPVLAAKFIPLIAVHAHRLTVLELCKLSHSVVNLLSLTLSVYRLDRLEHLKLLLLDEHYVKPTPLKLKASPLLLTAQWCSLPKISIGWDRLSQFISTKGQDLSVQDFIYLLQNAPSLRYCLLSRVVFTEAPPKMVVHHSSLETLVIGYCQWDMWRVVTLPSLKTLHIDCAPDDQGWVSIRNFLDRSRCPITDLSLCTTGRAHLEKFQTPCEIFLAWKNFR
ncbi:hypothetical protein CPB83DRAFT_109588 [Crepidotus variabilis]|uniref:F-box domain-containing protein n=1 Tax=Crepidotus variabilis TaxID=179855 RepID=A0A9P6EMB0_9AGAR|nr:hypothetical protein CPB83DRAFT_109588 [Crepidotus variabilis]